MSKCKPGLDGNKIAKIQVKTKAVSADQPKQVDAASTQKPLGDPAQQSKSSMPLSP